MYETVSNSEPSTIVVSSPPPSSDFGSWNHFGRRVAARLRVVAPERERELRQRRDGDSERQRLEKMALVERDRLGDELADVRRSGGSGSGRGCGLRGALAGASATRH